MQTKQNGSLNLGQKISYKCEICHDCGWLHPLVEGKPDYGKVISCRCQKEIQQAKRQKNFLKYCELPESTEDRTFANFKCDRDGKLRDAMTAARQVVQGELKFLTLISDVDRGKTHLAIAICRQWLADGGSAKYAFVPLLLDELRAGFQIKGDESYENKFNFYRNVGLLVLDDLGAESKTEWAIEKLETIIDYRYINEFPTVITTNCEISEFTPRIRSRIQRAKNSKIVIINSPEYRLWRKKSA